MVFESRHQDLVVFSVFSGLSHLLVWAGRNLKKNHWKGENVHVDGAEINDISFRHPTRIRQTLFCENL